MLLHSRQLLQHFILDLCVSCTSMLIRCLQHFILDLCVSCTSMLIRCLSHACHTTMAAISQQGSPPELTAAAAVALCATEIPSLSEVLVSTRLPCL